MRAVWEKERKVVGEVARKIRGRLGRREEDQEMNPEGEWEGLVRGAVGLGMERLEGVYRGDGGRSRKQRTLAEINLLLDLVLFQ